MCTILLLADDIKSLIEKITDKLQNTSFKNVFNFPSGTSHSFLIKYNIWK